MVNFKALHQPMFAQGLLTLHGLETRIELTYKILSLSWFRLVPRPRDKTKPSLAFKEVYTCCTKLLCVFYVQICNNSAVLPCLLRFKSLFGTGCLCVLVSFCMYSVFTLFAPIQIIIQHVVPLCAG